MYSTLLRSFAINPFSIFFETNIHRGPYTPSDRVAAARPAWCQHLHRHRGRSCSLATRLPPDTTRAGTPTKFLNGIHVAFAADDRALPDDELLMTRVEDVLKASFQAARRNPALLTRTRSRTTSPARQQDGYEIYA